MYHNYVLDGVARAKADPLRDRAILALLLAKNLLELQGLVRRLSQIATMKEEQRCNMSPAGDETATRQECTAMPD